MKIIQFTLLLFCVFAFKNLSAQETVPATGGNASGAGGSVAYSVGQVAYTSSKGTNGSVAQGVQQPFEISVVSGLEEGKAISLKCDVYPNPATDFLILSIEGDQQTKYTASLFDINSKLLTITEIKSNETRIDLSNFAPATYFLKIEQIKSTSSSKSNKTFKIIKN